MLFNIEEAGHRIAGWLVPDNPSAQPSIMTVLDGVRRRELVADGFRPDILGAGLHGTGFCGFLVDEETCPGYTPESELELFDTDSNLLLYRRTRFPTVALRLFHLDTQTVKTYPLERVVSGSLQMIYTGVETIAEEALFNLIHLTFESIFVSGSLLYRRYEPFIRQKGFSRSILLSDPYRELAGRLLRLKKLGGEDGWETSWKGLGQARLIRTFVDADLADPGSLARAIRNIGDEDVATLSDPTLRKLVAKQHDEPLQDHHVGAALDSLAEFDLVGLDDQIEGFVTGLEALLGVEGLPRDALSDGPEVTAVVAALLRCRPARDLVRLDEALLGLVRNAVQRADGPGGIAEYERA